MAIRKNISRFGLLHTLRAWLYYRAYRWFGFRAIRGMTLTLDRANSEYGTMPGFTGRRVDAPEFYDLIGEEQQITEDFINHARSRGDWCYCIENGNEIASYGWYSKEPVPAGNELLLHFSPTFLYMYKGFTRPAFRGQRLHARGMIQGLNIADAEGYGGLIGYVDAYNSASLKSARRMGYVIFGTCFAVRAFGRVFSFATPGCWRFGFRLADQRRGRRLRQRVLSHGQQT